MYCRKRFCVQLFILGNSNRNMLSVTPFPEDSGHPEIQHAQWLPDGQGLLIIYENDIYIKDSAVSPVVSRITNTGKKGEIFNGVTDYLYYSKLILYGLNRISFYL